MFTCLKHWRVWFIKHLNCSHVSIKLLYVGNEWCSVMWRHIMWQFLSNSWRDWVSRPWVTQNQTVVTWSLCGGALTAKYPQNGEMTFLALFVSSNNTFIYFSQLSFIYCPLVQRCFINFLMFFLLFLVAIVAIILLFTNLIMSHTLLTHLNTVRPVGECLNVVFYICDCLFCHQSYKTLNDKCYMRDGTYWNYLEKWHELRTDEMSA